MLLLLRCGLMSCANFEAPTFPEDDDSQENNAPNNNPNNDPNNNPNNTTNNNPNNDVPCEGLCDDGTTCVDGQCGCDPQQHLDDEANCNCDGPCMDGLRCEQGECVDLCAEVNCEPPSDFCDGNVAVTHDGGGVCIANTGMCDNPVTQETRNCADDDLLCHDGACCDPRPRQFDTSNCGCSGPCEEDAACIEGVCVAANAPLEICENDVCVATQVLIPAGPFLIGPNVGDTPLQEVTLTRPYLMQRTEVTQKQYEGLVGNNPSYYGPGGEGDNCGADCPVEFVSWFNALAYCNALSAHEGLEPCYDDEGNVIGGENEYECEGWRLPTNAEWEKAARGEYGNDYAWGEEAPSCERAVIPEDGIHGCGQGTPSTVGSKPLGMSPYGLHDMTGNVYEWTSDTYEDGEDSNVDPLGTTLDTRRPIRGGSYNSDDIDFLHANWRFDAPRDQTSATIGFRCVKSN